MVNNYTIPMDEAWGQYWVGFICADGSVCNDGYSKRVVLAQKSGEEYLQVFKERLGCTNKISTNAKGLTVISVGSKTLVEQMISLGVKPRKGFNYEWGPTGPMVESRHFWRGMIDGDGSLMMNENLPHKSKMTLTGGKGSCESFIEFAHSFGLPAEDVHQHGNVFKAVLNGKSAATMSSILYSDCEDYLQRKSNLAHQMMEQHSIPAKIWSKQSCRAFYERAALVSHCGNGHEKNESNTYAPARGRSYCRPCNKERAMAYKARMASREAMK